MTSFREILDHFTEPAEVIAPPGLSREALHNAAYVLGEKGYAMPADYSRFLLESNGLVWNGVDVLGIPSPAAADGLHLLNAKSVLDPYDRIGAGKLLVGASESFLYAHNPATVRYERYFRADCRLEGKTYRNFPDMLTSIFEERLMYIHPYKPAGTYTLN